MGGRVRRRKRWGRKRIGLRGDGASERANGSNISAADSTSRTGPAQPGRLHVVSRAEAVAGPDQAIRGEDIAGRNLSLSAVQRAQSAGLGWHGAARREPADEERKRVHVYTASPPPTRVCQVHAAAGKTEMETEMAIKKRR